MAVLECSRAFVVVFVGLVLGTAGFCLTLAGWFAPPINDSVRGVRLAGPVLLVIGLLVLLFSCLMCAISQHLCCQECVQFCYDRHKDMDEEQLERTIHVNVNHTEADIQPGDSNHPLILGDMQDAFDACNMVSTNRYASVSPLHRLAQQNRINNTYGHLRASDTEYESRIYQSRLSSGATCGYHESETTDSTPSTSPVHRPLMYDGLTVMSPAHHTMYEGVGVRVKQFRTHGPPYQHMDECENKELHDMSMHSATSSPYSSPNCTSKDGMKQVSENTDTDNTGQSETPTLQRKNSEHNVILPKPGIFLERDPNIESGTSPKSPRPEDPVWTPRATRWRSPSISRDNVPPPPYRDPFVIHSDV